MLKTSSLDFKFPSDLVATQPCARGESRIFLIPRANDDFRELGWADFFSLFSPGDLLVLNDTKVFKARLLIGKKEVFFLRTLGDDFRWEVLTKRMKGRPGKEFLLPGNIPAKFIVADKISQIEILNPTLFIEKYPGGLFDYFEKEGHVPLPPYILALRESHMDNLDDVERYQTVWAKEKKSEGSVAAPTASLHFSEENLKKFFSLGVKIEYVTLHVGAGTFLPIDTENIADYEIHHEQVTVSQVTVDAIAETKKRGGNVWACGTTVMRALETVGKIAAGESAPLAGYSGETNLFIKPGFEFKIVDGLLTNFHQPQSSLLILAASFSGLSLTGETAAIDKILRAYALAIEKKFRLFSYGDLTVIV